jgi:hypothetical protein
VSPLASLTQCKVGAGTDIDHAPDALPIQRDRGYGVGRASSSDAGEQRCFFFFRSTSVAQQLTYHNHTHLPSGHCGPDAFLQLLLDRHQSARVREIWPGLPDTPPYPPVHTHVPSSPYTRRRFALVVVILVVQMLRLRRTIEIRALLSPIAESWARTMNIPKLNDVVSTPRGAVLEGGADGGFMQAGGKGVEGGSVQVQTEDRSHTSPVTACV